MEVQLGLRTWQLYERDAGEKAKTKLRLMSVSEINF